MSISSIWKQAVRTLKLSLAAFVCLTALSFGMAAPSFAAGTRVLPTQQLALFGFGRKAEGQAEELVGKAQSKIGSKIDGTGKQVEGRAKYEIGRVEDAAARTGDKIKDVAKDIKQGTQKNLDKVKNTTSTSSVTKGETQLPETISATEEVAEKTAPMGLKEVEARNKNGLNEVQGSADIDKMYKADTSKPGTALAKKIDKTLDKIAK